jgi:hypothetical protein
MLKESEKIEKNMVSNNINCLMLKTHGLILCISGVSIQFLCSPRPEEPVEHVTACLQALHTLLESPYARIHIAEDQVQCISIIDNCMLCPSHITLGWLPHIGNKCCIIISNNIMYSVILSLLPFF